MQVRLIHITTRSTGSIGRREEMLEVEALKVGRGTSNDVTLADLGVDLNHAEFHKRSDGIYVERTGTSPLLVNGDVTSSARLEIGDAVRMGQVELVVAEPAGADLTLEITSLRQRGTELEDLRRRTRIGVEQGFFARRPLSWAAVGLCAAGLLVLPLAWSDSQEVWSSGEVARKHSTIADECGVCHTDGFARVKDESCLTCHADVGAHVDTSVELALLDTTRCASCHKDHNGEAGLVIHEQPLCGDCHSDLKAQLSDTVIEDASDFGEDHPEFRLFVVSDPGGGAPDPLVWSPEVRERSGLQYSHWEHTARAVPDPEGESLHMRCDACHTLDPSGQYMEPISFEEHCQSCHQLSFDRRMGDAQAIHGDAARMREDLRGRYAELALKGEVKEDDAPGFLRFRRPGTAFTDDEKPAVYAWVEEQVRKAERHLFVKPGECARCHELREGAARDGGVDVSDVEVATVWMPRSQFQHDTHRVFACGDCHPQAAVYDPEPGATLERPDWSYRPPYRLRTPEELSAAFELEASTESSDVLVRGIDVCQDCHGGAGASPPKVPSECVLCHGFHSDVHGPMRHSSTSRGAREKRTHSGAVAGLESGRVASVLRE